MRHVFVCCGLTVAYLPEPIALPAVVVVEGYAKSVALASDTCVGRHDFKGDWDRRFLSPFNDKGHKPKIGPGPRFV